MLPRVSNSYSQFIMEASTFWNFYLLYLKTSKAVCVVLPQTVNLAKELTSGILSGFQAWRQ